MKLTGKCKQDFWIYLDRENLEKIDSLSESFKNSLIIEWLDSLGIYILPYREDEMFYCEIQFSLTMAEKSGKNWILTSKRLSRNESLSDTILRVNDIYNSFS
jgi:hypothetical protein